jgi:hypothetical protein
VFGKPAMEVIYFPARRSTEIQNTRFMDSMIVTNNSNSDNNWYYWISKTKLLTLWFAVSDKNWNFCAVYWRILAIFFKQKFSVSVKCEKSTPVEIRGVKKFTESIKRCNSSCNTRHLQCRHFLRYLNFWVNKNLLCVWLVATVCTGITILIH